jgi:hypothetical protein
MELSYLDQWIPKRWVLLLRYYLPFFKRPEPIYFELRQFINNEKRSPATPFNLDTLFNLFRILDNYPCSDLSDKIIDSIISNERNFICDLSIEALIEKFNSKLSDNLIDQFLKKLPTSLFEDYIDNLNKSHNQGKKSISYYKKHIKYFEKFRDKFTLKSEMLLLYNGLIPIDNIKKLIDFLKNLYIELKNDFLNFIMQWKAYFSPNYNNFPRNEYEHLIDKIFNRLNEEQIPTLLDTLIKDYFNPSEKKPSILAILTYFKKNLDTYSLNLFQILSVSYITTNNADIHSIAQKHANFLLPYTDLATVFSDEIQVTIIKNSIKSLQIYIGKTIIEKVAIKPEKLDLHTRWRNFISNNPTNYDQTPLQQLDAILEKIPREFKEKENASLALFKQLYHYLEMPPLKAWIEEEEDKQRKQQLNEMEIEELEKTIRENTSYGIPLSLSYQRIEELYGDKAPAKIEQFKKNAYISFFDANDREKTRAVIDEIQQAREFEKRFSC